MGNRVPRPKEDVHPFVVPNDVWEWMVTTSATKEECLYVLRHVPRHVPRQNLMPRLAMSIRAFQKYSNECKFSPFGIALSRSSPNADLALALLDIGFDLTEPCVH